MKGSARKWDRERKKEEDKRDHDVVKTGPDGDSDGGTAMQEWKGKKETEAHFYRDRKCKVGRGDGGGGGEWGS